jgi:hypothetical protein
VLIYISQIALNENYYTIEELFQLQPSPNR